MKHTKITRRIDELGRIVIPKEIRNNLNIKNGENIEISVDDNNILLSKYSLLKNNWSNLDKIVEIISRSFNLSIKIFDRENLICEYPITIMDLNTVFSKELVINSNLIGYIYIDSKDNNLCKQISNLIVSLIEL